MFNTLGHIMERIEEEYREVFDYIFVPFWDFLTFVIQFTLNVIQFGVDLILIPILFFTDFMPTEEREQGLLARLAASYNRIFGN